tara:strand:+ start:162 stop:545 length:384 start_codon:yes stop_codon:yes gene_type:complete
MRKQRDMDLIADTLSTINVAVTNIYTKIDRSDSVASPEQRELVDTFNELVTLEQKLIDMIHPKRHEIYDGKLPAPKYLAFKHYVNPKDKLSWVLIEEQRDYEVSPHWHNKIADLNYQEKQALLGGAE